MSEWVEADRVEIAGLHDEIARLRRALGCQSETTNVVRLHGDLSE